MIFILSYSFYQATAQQVTITCNQKPLNEILISLRDDYNLMISFDDEKLATFKLSVNKNFPDIPATLNYLFKGLPLAYEVNEGVYIIYSVQLEKKPGKYILSGKILDKTNLETLPFSTIQINNYGMISDAQGNFSYTSTNDSVFHLIISYLGYYIIDTTVRKGSHYKFYLTPSVIAFKEIVIEGSVIAKSIQTGIAPGITKLNHKIAYFLPGNGDNSIFNLLRLQPGILAAGEQSADMIIWGAYEGHSQVIFDGFTLYGMKNFNDNISAVNPYMAKDIKVLKGAFGAEYGEKVGGIVDITGVDGNRLKPSAQFCINNMTINGSISIPFKQKSSLVVAYRQTYYDLYDPVKFTSSSSTRGRGSGSGSNKADYYITPDYIFRDINIKYSGNSKKSNYYVSLYGGQDNYNYSFAQEGQFNSITMDYLEKNNQLGGAAFYGLNWNEKNTSSITLSYSYLETLKDQEKLVERTMGNQSFYNVDERHTNEINELNGKIDNKLNLTEKHTANAGLGFLYYFVNFKDFAASVNEETSLPLPYVYLQDNINVYNKLTLKPGLRADYHVNANRLFIQPRLSIKFNVNDFLKINSAIGMYNQFVAKNMTMDTSKNYTLAWEILDDKDIPVLHSNCYTLGASFNKNNFTASVEGFYRKTGDLTRYLLTNNQIDQYTGDSKTKGLDFFIKKEFKKQTWWIAYTLSNTMEHFPYFDGDEYEHALHDQLHEIKLAGLVKLKPFYISSNFVYGSGFPALEYDEPYSRLDASVIYKFSAKKVHIDAGISVLNILNEENIKYSNYTTIPTDDITTVSVYSEAVPLTPTLFLNIYF
ncbi:MAG: TonB-dependent receptor [Bacteroidales bacterium]|nr:TonB-dependent receptor [Bacteroidales bacterium]